MHFRFAKHLFLGLAIGGTMEGHVFLKLQTLGIFALGFLAICFDTAAGVLFGGLGLRLGPGPAQGPGESSNRREYESQLFDRLLGGQVRGPLCLVP